MHPECKRADASDKNSNNPFNTALLEPVELLCLNLSGNVDDECNFDAFALLSRPKQENHPRSLIYPPFRVNELSITFSEHANEIELAVIDFGFSNAQSKAIVLTGANLANWYNRLKAIFPHSDGVPLQRPVLIQSKSNISSSGLGIAVVQSSGSSTSEDFDYLDGKKSQQYVYEEPRSATSTKFKELVENPTPLPLSRLQQQSQRQAQQKLMSSQSATSLLLDEYEDDDDDDDSVFNDDEKLALNLLPPSFGTYKQLNGSAISVTSSFEKPRVISIGLRKNSSGSRQDNVVYSSNNHARSEPVVKEIKRNTLDMEASTLSTCSPSDERPISYQAEIVDDSRINSPAPQTTVSVTATTTAAQSKSSILQSYSNQDKFSSVPNLNETKPKSSIYELGNASAIDISNFGKGYNPSFSIPKGLNSLLDEQQNTSKPAKKSFFGLFKKTKLTPKVNSKTVDMAPGFVLETSKNVKNLSISTDFECEEKAPLTSDSILSQDSRVSSTKPPAPFALPSSTSMTFFKQPSTTSVNLKNNNSSTNLLPEEENLIVPNHLKDIINDDDSIDFFITPSTPRAMKVSKWKQKYGKWEMLTVNEMVFMKIVVNYSLNKAWMIFFKEEDDEEIPGEVYDKPILLLDLLGEGITSTKTAALDYQITSNNSVTREKITIIVRCSNGNLLKSIDSNVENIMGVLGFTNLAPSRSVSASTSGLQLPASVIPSSSIGPKSMISATTVTSSIMDSQRQQQVNHSSTYSSINSITGSKLTSPSSAFPNPTNSSYAIDKIDDYDHTSILNNPDNERFLLLNKMKIRLQKNVGNYSQIHNPSSWKILSMNNLSVYMLTDSVTNATYYNLVVEGGDSFNWLINKEEKFNTIEKIGKAGMVLKLNESEVFLIECKGRKEFKALFELF